MQTDPEPTPVVIDWKQLVIYLALGLGLFFVAYELIERLAGVIGVENSGRRRGTLFGALALLAAIPVLRLLVRWLDFLPPPRR